MLVSIMSSAIGGYLSARLRTRRVGLHTDEVFFRDTAHGFVTWAFAALITATVLAGAIMQTVGGAASTLASTASQTAERINPSQIFIDRIFRSGNSTAGSTANNDPRAEVLRLWTSAMADNQGLGPADRTYIAQVISANAGISQTEAEQRLNQVIAESKDAADRARSNGAKLAFWITASLLFGAFAASWAAADGGQLRDGIWRDHRLMPRTETAGLGHPA
ncbi:MAG: hypothetical protein IT537_11340 [Hyphomicrobiales bacterium]|nr:hypothetical protein [Hyphomicrobiales bacterium]